MARKYGWRPDVPDPRDRRFNHARKMLAATPDLVDLRPKMPPVYDQGELGSCTANAGGAAFQFDLIKQGLPNWTPSRLALYYGERVIEGNVKEDAGAQIRDCVKVLATTGVAPESLWPYDISKFAKKPPVKYFKTATKNQALRYARVEQTQDALEQVLAQGYPIIFGFAVFESFESPQVAKTGMMPVPKKGEKDLGGHAVLCVGYDRKRKLFIVRNSWGPDWGKGGYFFMPYEVLLNPNMADDLWVVYSVEDGDDEDGE